MSFITQVYTTHNYLSNYKKSTSIVEQASFLSYIYGQKTWV